MIHDQRGQTLIETIAAIFILTTALVAGLALTISVLSSSTTSQNQIVAANLVREGIESVRLMRDSNWLAGDAAGGSWDLQNCPDMGVVLCYPRVWQGPTYPSLNQAGNYRAVFNVTNKSWSLESNSSYDLFLQSDGSFLHSGSGNRVYARKLNLRLNTAAPYSVSNPQVIVKSIVGWRGKNCVPMAGSDPETTSCKVIAEEILTNWKDYK